MTRNIDIKKLLRGCFLRRSGAVAGQPRFGLSIACRALFPLLGAVLIMTSCGLYANDASQEYDRRIVLRFAEFLYPGHPSAKASQAFAGSVYEKTDGRIEIRVQYNGELGTEREALEQLQFGGIAFTRMNLLSLADDISGLEAYAAPFARAAPQDVITDLRAEEERINLALEREQITVLAYLMPEMKCIVNATRDLKAIEDIAGLRLRTPQSRAVNSFISALGAFPVTMEENGVVDSLASDYIDGAVMGFLPYVQGRYSSLLPHVTLTSAFPCPDVLLAGWVSLGDIDSREQQIIRECGRAVFEDHSLELQKAQREALDELEALGVGPLDGKLLDEELKQLLSSQSGGR